MSIIENWYQAIDQYFTQVMTAQANRNGDDGRDNETIHVNLPLLDPAIDQNCFYLNLYAQQDFETIPYANISTVGCYRCLCFRRACKP